MVEGGELRRLLLGQRRRVDPSQHEIAEKHLAHEAGMRPLLLARGLGHLARLLLADLVKLSARHARSPIDGFDPVDGSRGPPVPAGPVPWAHRLGYDTPPRTLCRSATSLYHSRLPPAPPSI